MRAYWGARVFSTLAHSILGATLGWHVYELTNSSYALGNLGLVQFLATIPATLLGGALADNRDRRAIVATAQAAACLAAAGLAAATLAGDMTYRLLLGVAVALAVARGFESPANMALLPSLVPRELFPSAVVVSATARNLGFVSGPLAMGVIVDRLGLPAAYAAAACCFVPSALLIARLRPAYGVELRSPVSLRSILEGVDFVRSRPVILGAMSLDMLAMVFAGSTALLPVFATTILGVGALGFGFLAAGLSIGTTLMTVILLVRRPLTRPGRALFAAVAAFGLATIAFGLSRDYALSLAALVVAGMADEVSVVARSMLIQLSTPDALRGRVSSVNMVFIDASNRLGEAESGYLAGYTSAPFSVVFGGLACFGVLALVSALAPGLRHYRVEAEAPG